MHHKVKSMNLIINMYKSLLGYLAPCLSKNYQLNQLVQQCIFQYRALQKGNLISLTWLLFIS